MNAEVPNDTQETEPHIYQVMDEVYLLPWSHNPNIGRCTGTIVSVIHSSSSGGPTETWYRIQRTDGKMVDLYYSEIEPLHSLRKEILLPGIEDSARGLLKKYEDELVKVRADPKSSHSKSCYLAGKVAALQALLSVDKLFEFYQKEARSNPGFLTGRPKVTVTKKAHKENT